MVGPKGLGFLTALIAVVTLPAGILTYVLAGLEPAAVVIVLGWFLLVPVTALAAGYLEDRDDEAAADPAEDALETLRRRYAEGEIDEAEFERRVDRLIDTENIDVDGPVEPDPDREPEPTRERE